jgi:hypothetical protein
MRIEYMNPCFASIFFQPNGSKVFFPNGSKEVFGEASETGKNEK